MPEVAEEKNILSRMAATGNIMTGKHARNTWSFQLERGVAYLGR